MSDRAPESRSGSISKSGSKAGSDSGSGSVSRGSRGSSSPSRISRRFRILRILRHDRPFVVVVVLALVAGGLVVLGVPKLWRTTPQGFPQGVVRVSLVDLAQAWSLARTARRAEAAGMDEAALFAWRGALINNVGDEGLHRGLLHFLRKTPEARPDRALLALRSGSWLLALTRTNLADAALVGEVLERYGRPKVALSWLSGIPDGKDPAVEKARAQCLLSTGRLGAFASLWGEHGPVWKEDPVLALYQDAWLAMTDDRTVGLSATVRLKEGLEAEGEAGLAAARLLVAVASMKGQADDLGLALSKLEARRSATTAQHAFYWRVLAASGRAEEARELALAYIEVPNDPEMAAIQWLAMRDIGLTNALELAAGTVERYGNTLETWRAYFDLLAREAKWTELQRAAARARLLCARNDPLYVETVFAEYRAAAGGSRRSDEARLSGELAGAQVGEPETAIRISAALREAGRWGDATRLLKAHETRFGELAGYWLEVFAVGLGSKDLGALRRSVAELLRIEPSSVAWANNRAALLLITGEEPAEALRLTLAGVARDPGSSTLKINHALALVANGRAAEAEGILGMVAVAKLPPDAVANYHLAAAVTHAALGRTPEAVASAQKADRSRLLAPQVERLDRILAVAGTTERAGP